MVQTTHHLSAGLAAINLWGLLWLCILAQNLLTLLFKAHDLPALILLPVSESVMFRWELQKCFRRFALPALLDYAVGFGALAITLKFSAGQWVLAMLLAVLSWAMLAGLSAFCAARLPRLPYSKIAAALFVLGFVLVVTNKVDSFALRFIDSAAPTLNIVLPTGWAPSLLQLFASQENWLAVSFNIVPVVLVILTVNNSLEILRKRLKFREPGIIEAPDILPQEEKKEDNLPADIANEPRRVGVTAIEDIVQSRQFLHQPQPQGWLEKKLWGWFSPREKSLAEFAFPKGLRMTRPWFTVLRIFLVTLLLGFVMGKVDLTIQLWIFGIGLLVGLVLCLGLIWESGQAFRQIFNSGVLIPIYAAYPIAFRELSKTLFKVTLIQLPLLLCYMMAGSLLIAYLNGLGLINGIIFGFKAGGLIFSARFIIFALAVSSRTNDTARFRLRALMLVLLFIIGGCIFAALGVSGLFVPNVPVAWSLWLAAIADAYALFRIYGWFYDANRFDLMSLPRR